MASRSFTTECMTIANEHAANQAVATQSITIVQRRIELQYMKRKQLEEVARKAGLSDEVIEEADEADNPKDAFTCLILNTEYGTIAQRKLDLQYMKRKQLEEVARKAGLSEEVIEEADETDNPKDAFIRLILNTEYGTSVVAAQCAPEQLQSPPGLSLPISLDELTKIDGAEILECDTDSTTITSESQSDHSSEDGTNTGTTTTSRPKLKLECLIVDDSNASRSGWNDQDLWKAPLSYHPQRTVRTPLRKQEVAGFTALRKEAGLFVPNACKSPVVPTGPIPFMPMAEVERRWQTFHASRDRW